MAGLKSHELHTIGYVRELALSRKSGISKDAPAGSVKRSGIGHVHLAHRGRPKPFRNR